MKYLIIAMCLVLCGCNVYACVCKYDDGCNIHTCPCNNDGNIMYGSSCSITLMYCENYDPKWELIDIFCEDKEASGEKEIPQEEK